MPAEDIVLVAFIAFVQGLLAGAAVVTALVVLAGPAVFVSRLVGAIESALPRGDSATSGETRQADARPGNESSGTKVQVST